MNKHGFTDGPNGGRGSRLKPVYVDYLESIGLPSKGDNRLLDFKTQEVYFDVIVKRYKRISPSCRVDNALNNAFKSLNLDGNTSRGPMTDQSGTTRTSAPSIQDQESKTVSHELSTILMAMRKLREAIVASVRRDAFAREVYAFIIRTTILLRHMESYHPALLYLLSRIHPVVPLSSSAFHELLGYYILDSACRQNDLNSAYDVKYRCKYRDVRIEAVLKALAHGNWPMFWFIQNSADVHQKVLMEWAEDRMRKHALNCIGKAYLVIDKTSLEGAIRKPWSEVKVQGGLGWQLNGENITIRKIGRK